MAGCIGRDPLQLGSSVTSTAHDQEWMVATSVASRMPPQTKRGAGGTWTLARSYIYIYIYLFIYIYTYLLIYLFLCLSIFLLLFKYIYNIYILVVYFCLFSCSFIYSFYLFIC